MAAPQRKGDGQRPGAEVLWWDQLELGLSSVQHERRTVWEVRNATVFKGKVADISFAVDTTMFRVAWWFKHLGKGATIPVTMILLNIKECCTENRKVKKNSLESWIPPSLGVLKFNVDGSARGSLGQAGVEGVLRDSRGRVVCLFSSYLGIYDSNTAEVWAILRATEVCVSNPSLVGREIVIISDYKTAVSWVQDGGFGSINHVNAIYDIRCNLEKLVNTKIMFNSRASNSFADMLAKNGSNMGNDVFVWRDI
ncbi:hypothetical protein Q3G72_024390 [Acer saccharum]|nr:hypothetical protein Q3G72_024390 [Acer saccharum]